LIAQSQQTAEINSQNHFSSETHSRFIKKHNWSQECPLDSVSDGLEFSIIAQSRLSDLNSIPIPFLQFYGMELEKKNPPKLKFGKNSIL
jgi:hypothetical protein